MLAVHGTDSQVARNIVDSGFATLSTLDAGFYGAGNILLSINSNRALIFDQS